MRKFLLIVGIVLIIIGSIPQVIVMMEEGPLLFLPWDLPMHNFFVDHWWSFGLLFFGGFAILYLRYRIIKFAKPDIGLWGRPKDF